MNVEEIKSFRDEVVLERNLLLERKEKLVPELKRIKRKYKAYLDTRNILNNSIRIVHETFKEEIERIVSQSCQQVFQRNLILELKYEEKRNNIETIIIIKENNIELSPFDDLGGSIIDIIAFIFRIVLWHMSSPKPMSTLILDEPFRFVGKLLSVACLILKELSETLNFQTIIITHDDEVMYIADKIFKIENINGESIVHQLQNERVFNG